MRSLPHTPASVSTVHLSSGPHTLSLWVTFPLSFGLKFLSGSWRHRLGFRETSTLSSHVCPLKVPWLSPGGSGKGGPEGFPQWAPWLKYHPHTGPWVTAHSFLDGQLTLSLLLWNSLSFWHQKMCLASCPAPISSSSLSLRKAAGRPHTCLDRAAIWPLDRERGGGRWEGSCPGQHVRLCQG